MDFVYGKDEFGGRRVSRASRAEVAAELSSSLQTLGVCMLKIQRSANGRVVFTLSGRIEAEDIKELREVLALETARKQLVLDLKDVTLVNQDAVKFLASCEADSVKLENCPAYIREWIERVNEVAGRLETCRLE
jgi:anti-anti-sigma regulatory factor